MGGGVVRFHAAQLRPPDRIFQAAGRSGRRNRPGSLDLNGGQIGCGKDPVVAIETHADNLRRLKALYIDCGKNDQFNLLYGARRFVRRVNQLGIAHRYEEFPDNHTGVDYRMDESLPFLAQALSG
jgi:hypothetical protein